MTKTVTIVGVGGVGSWIAEFLARAGVRTIIIDGDTVEAKNLKYSNYFREDIDVPKAVAISRHIRALAERAEMPNVFPEAIPRFIEDFDENGSDLVVLCVDSIMARIKLISSLEKLKVPWMDCRAEGKNYQIFTHTSKLINDFLAGKNLERRTGCQLTIERIEAGNLMCAAKATQIALNILRGDPYPAEVFEIETLT